MRTLPISFGMSAIFTKRGTTQFIKASTNAKDEKADTFIRAGETFKTNLEATQHVDVVVDKTGVIFPRLKAKVVEKNKRKVLSTVKQPIWDKTSTRVFEEGQRMAEKAEKAYDTSSRF